MDSIQNLIYQAAECFGNGNLKTSYQLYLKALDVAVHELQQVEFVDQYIIAINNYSDVFAVAKSCLQNAQEITLQSATRAKKRPKNPPPPVPVKPLSISSSKSSSSNKVKEQLNQNSPAPPLPARHPTVQRAPSPINSVTPVPNDNTVWKSIKPVVSPLLPFKNRLFDSSDDDVTVFEDEDEDILDFDNDEKRDECKSRPSMQRQASVSTISTVSSQLTVVNPLQAVKKALLTLPIEGKQAIVGNSGVSQGNEQDGLILMATGAVDPTCVTKAHTFTLDALTPGTATTENVPSIPQPPLFIIYKCLQQKLDSLEHRSLSVAEVKASLNKVRSIHMSATTIPSILQFSSALVAYQLTLIDSAIFRNIQPKTLLLHSPKSPHPAIVASTDFFNYLTRTIEHSIILQQEASGRAQHIHYWVKVASWCHDLKNFQTLKAIISALGTPPIQRLKRSWAFVPKKSMHRLEALMQLMSEESNYERYRERIDTIVKAGFDQNTTFREPIIPFLGVFLHDMTYLAALPKTTAAASDARITELLDTFSSFQKHPPYSSALAPMCLKDVLKSSKQQRKLTLIGGGSSNGVKNEEESSVEMQQCLATQYLLTRTWVGEKTVDELSLIREPPKTARSCSAIETSAPPSNTVLVLPPSPSGVTGSPEHLNIPWSRSGSMSVASGYSSSVAGVSTRPTSLEDNHSSNTSSSDLELALDDRNGIERGKSNSGGFWFFGRKSIDHCDQHSSTVSKPIVDKKRQRLSRHFSFEDLNVGRKQANNLTTIFRKEIFWRQSSMSQYSSSPEELMSPPHPLEPHPSLYKHEHHIV